MFARTQVQSRPWRLFAIFAACLAIPLFLKSGSITEWLRAAVAAVALVGLAGYAFGFRIGPPLFWRVFSVIFTVVAIIRIGHVIAPSLLTFSARSAQGAHHPAVIALLLAMFAALCVALFRHSELISAGPQSQKLKPSEPLFPSRAEQIRRVAQTTAEARAEMERPMTPAMIAEAQSFGPRRQLSLKQHQRITTFLLLATMALQAALAILYQGTAHILMLAVSLGTVAAAATFCSAELILKTRAKIRESWKAVAALLAITAVSFLAKDSPISWLLRVILSDVTALVLGNFLVVSLHIVARRD